MRLHQILHKIKQIQAENLPGFEAHVKMSPPFRRKYSLEDVEKFKAKLSAVMILLYEKEEECHVVFTQRHEYKGAHSGQISLPGGKKEAADSNFAATAIRETYEEIGVKISEKNIVKELSWLYVAPSNFIIYPFVAFSEDSLQFQKQESEVKEILECKVSDLLDKTKQKKYLYKNEALNIEIESPSFEIEGKNIWGATAMILSEFISVIES